MKIWIGLCITWLMVRVVSAQSAPLNNGLQQKDFDSLNYGRVQRAVEYISISTIGDEKSLLLGKVVRLINSYDSFAQFLRGTPFSNELIVPKPTVTMSPRELKLYNSMARKRLYPEVRVVDSLRKSFIRLKKRKKDFLLKGSEIKKAQDECFEEKDYTYNCTLKKGLEESIYKIVSDTLKDEFNQEDYRKISKTFENVIIRNSGATVINSHAFERDVINHWTDNNSIGQLIVECITLSDSFSSYLGSLEKQCKNFLEVEINNERMDENLKVKIYNDIELSFVYGIQTFHEEVLEKKLGWCFSRKKYRCKRNRISSRLEEWPHYDEISPNDINKLVNYLMENWYP